MLTIKFFVTPVYPYGNDHYYHEIIALAEGFEALGYSVIGNCNYWYIPDEKRYLIAESNESDFDIAIYDHRYVKSFDHLLFRKGYPNFDFSKKHILVDRNDWINPIWNRNPNYKIFDLILGCHTVAGLKYPSNYFPWAMGLTNRMINGIDQYRNNNIDSIIGYNFRVWHNLRELFISGFTNFKLCYPVKQLISKKPDNNNDDIFYYNVTTKRHSPDYYKTINESLLFLGFGGYIEVLPKVYQPYSFIDKIIRKPFYWLSKKDKLKYSFVFQWDSFRMWELFYSNSCPLLLNFKGFNFELPVMPIDGKHYIAINNSSIEDLNKKLISLTEEEIKTIGQQGKTWVKKHYAPIVQAKRLLEYLTTEI